MADPEGSVVFDELEVSRAWLVIGAGYSSLATSVPPLDEKPACTGNDEQQDGREIDGETGTAL